MTQKCVCVNVIILSSVPRDLRQFHKVNSVLIRHASLDSEHLESGQHGSKRVSVFFGGGEQPKKASLLCTFLKKYYVKSFCESKGQNVSGVFLTRDAWLT